MLAKIVVLLLLVTTSYCERNQRKIFSIADRHKIVPNEDYKLHTTLICKDGTIVQPNSVIILWAKDDIKKESPLKIWKAGEYFQFGRSNVHLRFEIPKEE
uniref:Uncharacterized protein n=1 Tax=Panagrolaimus sp. JU765 TaxID=591449 RepID=A0AC34Q6L6_9BILA